MALLLTWCSVQPVTAGLAVSLVPDDGKSYAVATVAGRQLRETSAVGGYNRPAQPIVLYEFEGMMRARCGRCFVAEVVLRPGHPQSQACNVVACGLPSPASQCGCCVHPLNACPATAHPTCLPTCLYSASAGCPFCRKVREAVAILDLDVKFLPCPKVRGVEPAKGNLHRWPKQ